MMLSLLFGAESAGFWLALLVDVSVKGVVVLLCAAAVAAALRRASAAARHAVWSFAFMGLLALPALSLVLPTWEVPILPGVPPTAGFAVDVQTVVLPTVTAEPSDARRGGVAAEPSQAHLHWSAIVLGVWFAGALLRFATLVLGLGGAWRLARRARPLAGGDWPALVERARSELRLRRPVRLLESRESPMPMTWGILRPVVLLPSVAKTWPVSRQQTVLLHELAHVRRRDHLPQLAAETACAFHWFNPLVWLVARRLHIEREHACDDEVLNAGSKASEYAGHLLETARSLRTPRVIAFATMSIARQSQLTGRLLAVLEEKRDRRAVSRHSMMLASLVAASLVLLLAAARPAESAKTTSSPLGRPVTSDARSGVVAGATQVDDVEAIQSIGHVINQAEPRRPTTARQIERLFTLGGAGLFLQISQSGTPFRIVLRSSDGRSILIPLEGAGFLMDRPNELDVGGSRVFSFWIEGSKQEEYVVLVPRYIAHLTLIANGREVLAARPLDHSADSLVFRIK